jgi:hypothetical protein
MYAQPNRDCRNRDYSKKKTHIGLTKQMEEQIDNANSEAAFLQMQNPGGGKR